jgi:hypothetical protein
MAQMPKALKNWGWPSQVLYHGIIYRQIENFGQLTFYLDLG